MSHTFSNSLGEWDVHHLWALVADLPVTEADPTSFQEWGEYGWETDLTLGGVAAHMKRVLGADLSYPIIVSAEGEVMDGCHRLVKAWLEGAKVKLVRFERTPNPDFPSP